MNEELDLDALQRFADAATPGPWEHQPYGGQNQNGDYSGGSVFDAHGEYVVSDVMDADGALIAASRTAVPALLDRVRELEAERDSIQFVLNGFRRVAEKDNEYLIGERDAALSAIKELEAELEARIEDRGYWYRIATEAKDQRDAARSTIAKVRLWALGLEEGHAITEEDMVLLAGAGLYSALGYVPSTGEGNDAD